MEDVIGKCQKTNDETGKNLETNIRDGEWISIINDNSLKKRDRLKIWNKNINR